MKKSLVWLVLLLFVSTSGAATYFFRNDIASADPNNWQNPLNWLDSYLNPSNMVPAATDSVSFTWDDFKCYLDTAATIRYLYCPYDGRGGHLIINEGGILTVTKSWGICTIAGSNGIIDVNDLGVVDLTAVNATVAMTVDNEGVLNVKGIVTSPKDMYISYGLPDIEGVFYGPSTLNVNGNGNVQARNVNIGVLANPHTGIINITDANASFICSLSLCAGNGGRAIVDVNNGLIECTTFIAPYGLPDPETNIQYADANVVLRGSGRLVVHGGYAMSMIDGSETGKLTMKDDAVLKCYDFVAGQGGAATVNMNGGLLDCNSFYLTQFTGTSNPKCNINLFGGTINVKLNWAHGFGSKRYYDTYGNDNAHVDIRNDGKLVVPYLQWPEMIEDVNLGIITAYGGEGFVKILPDAASNTCTLTACMDDVAGDVTGDCFVDYDDITVLAMNWLSEIMNPANINEDLDTNFEDYAIIASDWLLKEE